MKNAKKHFSRALTLLLSVLFIFQSVSVPAFAAENPTENIETIVENVLVEEDSTFTLANANVQISDEYGNETDYISEVQIPDIEQSTETNVEDGIAVVTDYPGDDMVYLTQRWLNQEYGHVAGFGSVPENGKTGWDTVYGLTRALQIELGITSLANNFGPTTQRLYGQNPLQRQDGVTNRKFAILQGALWCKGYCPGYNLYEAADGTIVFNGVFDADVEEAVIELKTDAGFINPNGVVTVNVMKALMTMDTFKLLSSYGGTAAVREMQQKLNRKYEAYTGITPCDGVYGRNTNKALIYALQAEEGLPTSVANGNFGNTTKLCCPEIPYIRNSTAARRYPGTSSGSYYSASQIASITELLQFALLVNGFDVGEIDGVFGPATQQALRAFQKKMSIPQTGKADKTTWLSLFVSCGDTSRSAKAADCATILTAAKAKTLYDNGYRYIGRYLTGTYNGGISKAITRAEAQIIFDAGLNFFPIYQTSANSNSYFTSAQGTKDAKAAITAAASLGIPANTIIYFAVDYDCLDYQITSNVIPYFKSVHEVMSNSIYRTGIYGTRNACTRVSEKGYACSSFVGDMSTGFSGNLGFSMPDNWAFDQFYTTSIGSGSGYLEIDKDGFSGRDYGVSFLNEVNESEIIPDFNFGSTSTDTLTGPSINIFGHEYPLFSKEISLGIPGFDNLIQSEKNYKDRTVETTIGWANAENDPNVKTEAYSEIKKMINTFGGDTSRATWNNFQKYRSKLAKKKVDFGFEFDAQIAGYVKTDLDTGEVLEGGMIIFAESTATFKYPLVAPILSIRLDVVGSMNGKFTFEVVDTNIIQPKLSAEFSPALKIGADLGIEKLFDVFTGFEGNLEFELEFSPNTSISNALEIKLNGYYFLDISAFLFETSRKWEFGSLQIYPQANANQINTFSITQNDLAFIEPIDKSISVYSTDPNVFEQNMQVYCEPKIISLGNGKMFMVYIDDAQNRTAENRTILMYSVYDGTTWSSPQPVSDDTTGDFKPLLYPDGNGGAHIVWLNGTTLYDSDVTLDSMASNTDIMYTHWNGNLFENTYRVTNNNSYEMNYRLTASDNKLSIVWQQNLNNDPFASSGVNSIYRREFSNNAWEEIELISSGIGIINSIDTTYVNGENVIAFAAIGSESTSTNEFEIYYCDSNGISELTNDNTADYCVTFLGNELYWVNDNQLLTRDTTTTEIMLSNMGSSISKIKGIEGDDGRKAIVWTQNDNVDMKFYISYYNETNHSFTTPMPISNGDDIIRSWDICMLTNGETELAYCAGMKTSDTNNVCGQIDLMQMSGQTFADISVNPVSFYAEEVYPGSEITLITDVYNVGSEKIEQFDISIINDTNNVVQTLTLNSVLDTGEHTQLEIPFVLPNTITLSDYTIQVIPHGKNDVLLLDNTSLFTIGFADLAIKGIQEQRTDNGRQLNITVTNQGYETIDAATLKIYKNNINGSMLFSSELQPLESGTDVVFTYDISNDELSTSSEPNIYYIVLETDTEDVNYSNNSQDMYIYPDCALALTTSAGGSVQGTGSYPYGSMVTICAIPDEGYIFDGWYENGKKLDELPQDCNIEMLSHRNIEGRFKANDLSILDIEIFGTLQINNPISITPSVVGGDQPYQWEFFIYKDNELCYTENTTIPFFEWTANTAGSYNVVVRVSDITGFEVSLTHQFTVTQ